MINRRHGRKLNTVRAFTFILSSTIALGIGAASFWSEAEKDRAESPTAELQAETERPRKETQNFRTSESQN